MSTLNPILNIKNILLLKSNFSRINEISGENLHNNVNIDIKTNVNGNIITIFENVKVDQTSKGKSQVSIEIEMVATYEKKDEKPIENLENFAKTIGASIIFPYIREHVTNLSLKAGVPIILPRFDFMNNE